MESHLLLVKVDNAKSVAGDLQNLSSRDYAMARVVVMFDDCGHARIVKNNLSSNRTIQFLDRTTP